MEKVKIILEINGIENRKGKIKENQWNKNVSLRSMKLINI